MVVEHIVIHPNFTDYKDDLGTWIQFCQKYTRLCKCAIIINIIIIIIIIVAALLKLPRPAPSSLVPLCLPPPSTDDLLGLRFFFAFACLFFSAC